MNDGMSHAMSDGRSHPDGLPRCLVIGGVNVDLLGRVDRFCDRDEAAALEDFTVAPGGHAGNCAMALARLETPVRLFARLGEDAFAGLALAALERAGVETGFIGRTPAAPTGLVFIPVLPDGDKALYLARGANELLAADGLDAAAAGCAAVVVFDPPLRLLPRIAPLLASRLGLFAPGGLVSAAPREVLAPLLEAARFLVVNGPESRVMAERDDPREAAAALAAAWGLRAIVTVGAGGCWVADPGGETTHCPGFAVEVRDATGAGDAFVAGLCRALLLGAPPVEAARRACAVGALATRALGAQAAHPTPEEIDAMLAAGSPADSAVFTT